MPDDERPLNPLGLHFDHEWQREAWEAEMRARRAKPDQRWEEQDPGPIKLEIPGAPELTEELKAEVFSQRLECGAMPYPFDNFLPGETYCDGVGHYRGRGPRSSAAVVGRCADLAVKEVQARVAAEEARLEGELELLRQLGPTGFESFSTNGRPQADIALAAMRAFSEGAPPTFNVFMAGPTGLGKTRLLLASHFARLRAGRRSMYVTTPELRTAFWNQSSRDEEEQDQARRLLHQLARAQVIHLDELGAVEDDERKIGAFREGLQKLLDSSRARWATATNLTPEKALKHPDVGEKIVSRFMLGASIAKMDGEDYRLRTQRKTPQRTVGHWTDEKDD